MSAASLYLALISQGLCLEVKPCLADPDGFLIRVHGLRRLDPETRSWAERVIFLNKVMLRDFMYSVSPDALAERDVTLEWRCYTDRRDADKQYHAIVDELEQNGRNGSKNPSANGARQKPSGDGKQQPPTHDELRDRWIDNNPNRAHGLGEWRAYERGTWPTVSETTVKGEIADEMEAAKPEGIKPTASILNSTSELARIKVYVPDEQRDADDDILVCSNGALRLSTRELMPHAKEHYATAGVPYAYARRATSEVWEERVMGELVAEHLGLGAVRFLQEYAGYCLTTSTEHEIAIWLTGKHGGGRSTILASRARSRKENLNTRLTEE
jgi:hypothetical protein